MNHFKTKNNKLEKLRGIFFYIGLIVAGGFTLLAFEWTFPTHIAKMGGVIVEEIEWDMNYVEPYEVEKEEEEIEEKEEETTSKSEDFEKVENDYKEKEEQIKEKKSPEKQAEFREGEWGEPEEIKEETPLVFAQHMPHYKDCKSLEEEERKKCTQEKMYQHFGKKIRIPETIKMLGRATYLAFVYFEINKKGEITNVKILNDEEHKIPKELEREAYNAVSSLPQLIPAKNNGKKVKILYKVPIKFTIR